MAMRRDEVVPWYERTRRWAQVNLTERDPAVYDAERWREQWRRTAVQGIIVNAGGIVCYYPSRFRLQHRALFLGERDLYGDIVELGRTEGLTVLARMDSNRASEEVFSAHPEWFARQRDGEPYVVDGRYIACLNSGYYEEFLADVLREIIERSDPDGITDNSWSGLSRREICYCDNCRQVFARSEGLELPSEPSWDDLRYRRWVAWSYERRLALWDYNNTVTTKAGGADCLWIGMNSADPVRQAERLRDLREICRRTPIFMLDFQTRPAGRGPHNNREAGGLLHEILGWDRLIPESIAMYAAGQPTFRVAAKPPPEVRLWAFEGMMGGISPWWHHIGSVHDDTRQYETSPSIFSWHEQNEDVLYNREPLANVGIVWSQRNIDFYGRDRADALISEPYWGVANALLGARIPWLPVHSKDIPDTPERFAALWLPNVGALSTEECDRLRAYSENGGSILASGETSLYDEWGDRRKDFELADVFGVHSKDLHEGEVGRRESDWETWDRHTYLRLHRPGPTPSGQWPQVSEESFAAQFFAGLEGTDIISFGGRLEVIEADTGSVLATWMEPFPMYPPEASWIREADSSLPALVVKNSAVRGLVAYLAADLDRCFGRDRLPDCGQILANLTRWATGSNQLLDVDGTGLVDVQAYRQAGRYVLHIVNLNHPGVWCPPVTEFVSVGPLVVRLRVAESFVGEVAQLRVSGQTVPAKCEGGWLVFTIPFVTDHEVAVVG